VAAVVVVGMLVLVVMVIIPVSSIQFLYINVFNQQPSDQQQIEYNISTLIKDNIRKNTHNKTKKQTAQVTEMYEATGVSSAS
jgi:hypothetical protein